MLVADELGNLLESRQMCRRIDISKGMICDEFQASFEKNLECCELLIHYRDLSISSAAARRGFG